MAKFLCLKRKVNTFLNDHFAEFLPSILLKILFLEIANVFLRLKIVCFFIALSFEISAYATVLNALKIML